MQTDTLQLACEESQMARTTFSGPVRSLAGFISAGVKNQVTLTAGQTLAVEPSHDFSTGITVVGNAGKMNITGFDLAGGASTLTLPLVRDANPADPTSPDQNNNFGAVIKIFLGNTLANDLVISCQGDDKLTGTALIMGAAGAVTGFTTNAAFSDVNVTLNGSTKGGIVDTVVTFTSVAEDRWFVEMVGVGSGTTVTPFS